MFSSIAPAVLIDVDGVVRRGNNLIKGSREAIIKLRKNNIPFAFLTNGGGYTEQKRARYLSKLMGLYSNKQKIKSNEIILAHTPMKDALRKYNNGLLVVASSGDVSEVMENYGYKNFISSVEYSKIFPQAFPYFYCIPESEKETTKAKVEKRLGYKLTPYPKISAIVQLTDLTRWELNYQLFSDILISPDGIPGKIRKENQPQKVDYHVACLDLHFMDKYPIPRLACGSFFFCLQELFKVRYKRDIKYYDYGKPSSIIFSYAKKEIKKNNPNLEISKFYMIGDAPNIDIKGANENGVHSILVRTGIFNGDNSKEYPAKTVVDNIENAVDYIISERTLL